MRCLIRFFNVNVRGVWNFCTSALAQMTKQKYGSIVIFGSGASFRAVPKVPIYNMTKHAVAGLTRAWAKDFASRGIRVNCVCPGLVDTPLSRVQADLSVKLLIPLIPAGRMGEPREIAEGVVFLLSSKASYINGQLVPINGAST